MKTWAALDPWVVNFDGLEDFHVRAEALAAYVDHVRGSLELEPLRFLDGDYWLHLYRVSENGEPQSYPPDLHALHGQLNWLQVDDVAVPDEGTSFDLLDRWRARVQAILTDDDSPGWRDPVVFAPERNRESWGGDDETDLGTPPRRRVVVDIADPNANPLYITDFDPWKSERSRSADNDKCNRDLPRPNCCEKASLAQLRERLSAPNASLAGDSLYFHPRDDWDPMDMSKSAWRRGPFERSRKQVDEETKLGPRDSQGRVWAWDSQHRDHWDVQHEGESDNRYMNVLPNGRVTKRYDD